jgi:hypothetical protein
LIKYFALGNLGPSHYQFQNPFIFRGLSDMIEAGLKLCHCQVSELGH